MRDGEGNKLSPEEQQRVKSIQGDPGKDATTKVSINPDPERDTGDTDKPKVKPGDKPAAGVGEELPKFLEQAAAASVDPMTGMDAGLPKTSTRDSPVRWRATFGESGYGPASRLCPGSEEGRRGWQEGWRA